MASPKNRGVRVVGAHVVFYKMISTPYNKDGKQEAVQAVLLYKRTQDAPIHPGYWALFGGKLQGGEKPEGALQREVKEELEVKGWRKSGLIRTAELCSVPVVRKGRQFLIQYFKARLDKDMDALRLKRSESKVEGEGLAWFAEEEAHHLMVRPEDRTALVRFFQRSEAN